MYSISIAAATPWHLCPYLNPACSVSPTIVLGLVTFASDYDDDHIDESGMVYDAHGA